MNEYKPQYVAQLFRNDRWFTGHAGSMSFKPTFDYEGAERQLKRMSEYFERPENRSKKPDAYRIAVRWVSEWEDRR